MPRGRTAKNYSGQIFGCWKVIERDNNPKSKSHESFWICECQNCKNIASVRKTDLDKQPRSCNNCKGLLSRKWKIGDRFGKLVIIGIGDKKESNGNTYVKVQCDCGSEPFDVKISHLKGQGHSKTISCGCASESAGEIKIKQLLESFDVNFKTQYYIKNANKDIMIFDFIIMDKEDDIKYCIEYDGKQHFQPIDFFGGEESFKKQQERDKRKNNWCKENNIVLLRIPYTDYNKVDKEYLLSKIPNLSYFKK